MQRFGKFSIRFIVALLCSVILTVGIFCCFNRAKVVKAEPITAGLTLGAVVMAFLVASGVAISSSGIDENNLDSSLSTMLSGYEKSDLTYEDWVNNIGDYDGLDWLIGRDNKAGAVAIGYELMDWLSGLPSWLIGTYSLSSSGNTNIISSNSIRLNGVSYPIYNREGSYIRTIVTNVCPLSVGEHVFYNSSNQGVCGVHISSLTSNSIQYRLFDFNNGEKNYTRYYSEDYYNGASCFAFSTAYNTLYISYGYNNVGSNYYYITQAKTFNPRDSIANMGLTGTVDDDYYQDYQDAVLPDINAQSGNDDAVGVIGLGSGVAEGALTQEQIIQNILDAVYANELDSTWTGVYEDQKTAEDDTDSEKVPTEAEIQGNMVIIDGLEDFFPFCIPFDLYEIISILNVPPETPEFTYTISFGSLFNSEDIDIDFHAFDGVAQVFRIMILIGFIVFLIIKTRDLIRG